MTSKRFTHKKWYDDRQLFDGNEPFAIVDVYIQAKEICNKLNELHDENEQLKKDVEYWKQVASQYSNELNVFEHCKKYKTECKDIHWSSD